MSAGDTGRMNVQTFRTVLEPMGGNNVAIVVPDDVVAAFEHGKRVPVVVTVDGDYSYANTIASMGGRFLISFNAATRAATGRGAGDEVEVRLEIDDAPRTVPAPSSRRPTWPPRSSKTTPLQPSGTR
jgi:hypothetical protein